MGIAGGPNLNQDGLVFMYDVFDQDNSYKGEPTINLATDSPSDVGGWGGYYSLVDSATKSFNLRVNDGGAGSAWKSFYWSVSSYIGQYITITANYTFGTQYNCNFQHITVGQGNTGPYPIHIAGSDEVDRLTISSKTSQQITWSGVINATGIVGFTVWLADASAGAYTICNVSNVQIEAKSHKTPFINGTRSSTQGLLDISSTNQIDISNASFNSNAQITFDGTNDYINVPYNTSHNLTNQGTISVWINPASLTQGWYAGLVSQSTGGSANSQAYQLSWRQVSGGLFGSICNGSGTYNDVLASFPSIANAWYNIVFTWNGSLLCIYNNGILSAQSAQTIVNQVLTTDLTIGGYTYKGAGGVDEYFNGSINNVELFNRGFTAQEVLQNYNTKKSRFGLK